MMFSCLSYLCNSLLSVHDVKEEDESIVLLSHARARPGRSEGRGIGVNLIATRGEESLSSQLTETVEAVALRQAQHLRPSGLLLLLLLLRGQAGGRRKRV